MAITFDDVHWSDDPSLDLIRQLARAVASQRVLVTLSFRSDEIGPSLHRLLADLDRTRLTVEVALSRLPAAAVGAMVRAILGARAGPGDELARVLHEFTDGNPFFVEEVLKGLVTSGHITRTADGDWRVRPFERVGVPRTATEAVRRRLGGLSSDARRLADIAAVAGRRFDFGLLQLLAPHDERELLALVKELIAAQLVVDESSDRFAFRHALTREAIYADLLARERVALHRDIAAAIERLHASALDVQVQALAYHAFQAGDWPSAQKWSTRAAEQAVAMDAPKETLAHLDRAFDAAARMGKEPALGLLIARGKAAETVGNFDAANADFTAALERSRRDDLPSLAWAALHSLGLLWSARDYIHAGVFRREALELARAIGEPALIARALNRVGNWHLNFEQAREGITHHEEALALFEALGDAHGVNETVDLLAVSHLIGGENVTAALYYERSMALFQARGDVRGLANAMGLLYYLRPIVSHVVHDRVDELAHIRHSRHRATHPLGSRDRLARRRGIVPRAPRRVPGLARRVRPRIADGIRGPRDQRRASTHAMADLCRLRSRVAPPRARITPSRRVSISSEGTGSRRDSARAPGYVGRPRLSPSRASASAITPAQRSCSTTSPASPERTANPLAWTTTARRSVSAISGRRPQK